MGATAAIEFGIRHPHMALSLTAAAAGSGASTDPAAKRRFQEECAAVRRAHRARGHAGYGRTLLRRHRARAVPRQGSRAVGPSSSASSPRGRLWVTRCTMIGVQSRRAPLFERKAELATIPAPVLIIAGDEDDTTLDLALFLKRTIPRCGLHDAAEDRSQHQPGRAGGLQRGRREFSSTPSNAAAGAISVTVAGKSLHARPARQVSRRCAIRARIDGLLRRQRRDLHVLRPHFLRADRCRHSRE